MQTLESPSGNNSRWSSQLMFCVAAVGSAVGLGNIWRFPYIAGEHGGGVFIVVYILCIVLLLPVMTGEIMLGRRGRRSPVGSMRRISRDFNFSPKWSILGWVCLLSSVLILSFYSVIAGSILSYWVRAAGGVFVQMTPDGAASTFQSLFSDPEKLLWWHTLFMMSVAFAVAAGLRSGMERMLKYLMPTLFLFLICLLVYAVFRGAFAESINFLFSFDPDYMEPAMLSKVFLYALGQAFFSLSLAYGSIMTYGAYLPAHANIVGNSILISVIDTLVAILAAIFIFSIVFKYGLKPDHGFSLIFETIPLVLSEMLEMGYFIGLLFFGLLSIAAWTSAISLLEPGVAWVLETFQVSRPMATMIVSIVIWVLGFGTIFSFTHPESWSTGFGTFFEVLDYTTNNVFLPIAGILIAVFTGWKLPAVVLREELHILTPSLHTLWRFALRYICPVFIFSILLGKVLHVI